MTGQSRKREESARCVSRRGRLRIDVRGRFPLEVALQREDSSPGAAHPCHLVEFVIDQTDGPAMESPAPVSPREGPAIGLP